MLRAARLSLGRARVHSLSIEYGEGLPSARRNIVVATIAITTVLSVLDGTIMNVALPTIAGDLHQSSGAVIWVVNAFALAQTMLIVPLSTYGDIGGFARLYRTGVVVFIIRIDRVRDRPLA